MFHIIASIFCYDIWFYASHILLHHRRLYRFHKEHHSRIVPTFADTYVGHALEGPFQSLGAAVPFLLWSGWSLLDVAAVVVLLNLRGMMRHDVRCERYIGNHHLLHHRYPNYNFGEYWLDTLFGTRYPNAAEYKRGLFYL